MRLYFLYAEGCGACEEAKPHLAQWEARRGPVELKRVDLLEAKWTNSWQPQATPTYVFEVLGRPRVMHEGALTDKQIDTFVAKAKAMIGVK